MKKFLLLILLLCLFATPCYANAGIPVFICLPTIINALFFAFPFRAFVDIFDTGLPGLFDWFCFFLLVLIGIFLLWLVFLVEYKYLRNKLPNIEPTALKKEVWLGNITTTLIGLIFLIPEPWSHNRLGFWIFGPISLLSEHNVVSDSTFFSLLLLYIPLVIYICFILSHRIEAFFIQKIRGEYTEKEIKEAVRKANRRSYWTLIIVLIAVSVIIGIIADMLS
ncbi:MAG: hypothetical protein J6Y03_00115 [Alphaproteobacteria bacterium]|nr:hypothetical protein [Alphaproteobacteria bacterium]